VEARSVRIARIAGIPVGISPWWLVIVALLTYSLGVGYFPDRAPGLPAVASAALALAAVMLLFAGILAHEFAHALVARRAGVEIVEIDLWLLGGVARMRNQPRRASDELRFALAGPALTLVLALVFGAIAWGLTPAAPAALRAFVAYQFQVNLAIALFNLLPALPLDGGRAARAVLWRRTGDLRRATVLAARGGRWIAYALIFLGVLAVFVGAFGGLWMAIVGLFLIVAASAEQQQVELEVALRGVTARELMSVPAVPLPEDLPVRDALAPIRATGYAAFPVVDRSGAVVGMLPAAGAVSASGDHTVGALADRDPELLLGPDDPVVVLLGRPAFARLGRAVVIDDRARPIGILSVSDLRRYVDSGRDAGAPRPAGVTR
jgi:Zn-dependent protease